MFAHQLTLLLDTLEVSLTDLAVYVQIDRTGISRMKSGSRVPKQNGASIRKLLHGIISYCADNGKTDTLRKLIGEKLKFAEYRQYLLNVYGYSNDGILTGSYSERSSAITMKQETEDHRPI